MSGNRERKKFHPTGQLSPKSEAELAQKRQAQEVMQTSKRMGANMLLTRFLDDDECAELKRAVEETWRTIRRNRDWVRGARQLK